VRPVNEARPSIIRSQVKRTAARRSSRNAGQAFGKREKPPGKGAGFWRRFFGLFSWRRPILLMTFLLSLLALVAAILISGVIGRAVHRMTVSAAATAVHAGFAIGEIRIAGNARTPAESIRAALGFKPGELTFSADLVAARERLIHLPWVKEAEVRRRYPGFIAVTVTEKQPFALWRDDAHIYVIERSGGLITDRGVEAFARLPRLEGGGAPAVAAEFVDAVKRHPAVAARVALYQYQSGRRWNLILGNGKTIKLPEYEWQKQLDDLERLIAKDGVLKKRMNEFDLRYPSFYFLRENPGQKPDDGGSTGEHAI
jgi:cell division protein FtsQ